MRLILICVHLQSVYLLDVVVSSLLIKQSLNLLIKPEETEARLDCHHGDSNYPYMLWYQHKSAAGGRGSMELIGLLYYDKPTMEKNFDARFKITGQSLRQAQLVISNITSTDSAKYFCAARRAQCFKSSGSFTKTCWPGIKHAPASNLKEVEQRLFFHTVAAVVFSEERL